ncbi:MAG: PIN domain-containing protein [Nitrospirota bacterium]|nr:PIN domain-containing protein [Nitrospirota bacterium]
MKYLIDTNIFLEILLAQKKRERCKAFLTENRETLYISDFSLHSIGVILFRNDKEVIFQKFMDDVVRDMKIITLPRDFYKDLSVIKRNFSLDFDDAYQYKIVLDYDLRLVTMDADFNKVSGKIKIESL